MGRKLRRVGWITLFFSGVLLLGCTKSAVRPKEVADPMLVTKPPVQGQTRTAHSSPLSRTPSSPPPPLPTAVDTPESP
jgi:hypothetical protein